MDFQTKLKARMILTPNHDPKSHDPNLKGLFIEEGLVWLRLIAHPIKPPAHPRN